MEAIDLRFGHDAARGLIFGILIYRRASEIAHGTLFGALFSWGALTPGRPLQSVSDMQSFRIGQGRLLAMLTAYALESLIRILAGELGLVKEADEAHLARVAFSTRDRTGD